MSATERLRKLLDKRGVKYETKDDRMGACETRWCESHAIQLTPTANLIMTVTPEQAIAATLGGGTLTAEQVCERVEEHTHDFGYDWQAIADELNAAHGTGECEIVEHYAASTRGEIGRERVKLSCGHIAERHSKFCQECGAKIREAVKR